ncbi:MAG: enoyl-CoA hydratase/isomerase family protein [Rhodospirillaceae bacterium]|jgi:enoyl-CoA hydratase|nr:enoyl-CoA hydratase/isomerase family protein [Rhodospirillaceae bacterium]MBT5193364.1 enoyl-CoA hydratase/isomerase family protein [Rhodospirillaceae bacterium]MBT5895187.1 enoyl-CoA hydratase/isomerase family protein [Rhodospirillaceae bacterium]MBT6429414.1 enoyl-CoA hydratase/isomerase family protein [Rhodospirillaceae bacterium]MBT7760763.1 enoyl-CoA hydratase/isomerase family protein [Rhodospirillaceae bacterium]
MVQIGKQDGATTLILNRPKQRNALDAGVIDGLIQAINEAEADNETRCLVIRGAGGNFCAGRDLTRAAPRDLASSLAQDETWTKVNRLLHTMSKPTVAVVEGYAVAGGFTLAMICDFVLAEEEAQFGALEMRRGFPAAINTPVLSQLVGPRLALEFLMFGDLIPARRLYEVGLINRLVEGAEALSQVAQQFVGNLVALDRDAVRMTKEAHRAARNMPLLDALEMGKLGNALIAASGRMDEAMQGYADSKNT